MLLPLGSIAVSLWNLAEPGDAEIQVTGISCRAQEVNLVVVNVGRKAGLVNGVDFKVAREPNVPQKYRDARQLVTDSVMLVKPNDSVSLRFRPSQGSFEDLPAWQDSKTCKYVLAFKMSAQNAHAPVVSCDCTR